jgi:4-hydroxyphenylacetate 3-monooxygenase
MDRVKSEDAIGAKGRPFTGAEYLESLRDGREVYIYGERVKDVTTHRDRARTLSHSATPSPLGRECRTAGWGDRPTTRRR